jgi:hypothetical protein
MLKQYVCFFFFSLMALSGLFCQEGFSTLRPIECTVVPFSVKEKQPQVSRNLHQHLSQSILTTVQGTSLNWSGYVTTRNLSQSKDYSVSHVTGSWRVPTIKSATIQSYSLIWVGMDGYFNHHLEQIGTGHNWGNGAQENFAWFQVGSKYLIKDFPVNIDDQIVGDVQYVGNGFFHLVLKNLTQGVSFDVPKKYTKASHALRSSAEWIVEVPFDHHLPLPLADFTAFLIPTSHTITFSNGWAKINGERGAIGLSSWTNQAVTMTLENGTTVKSAPSSLDTGKAGFSLTWQSQ